MLVLADCVLMALASIDALLIRPTHSRLLLAVILALKQPTVSTPEPADYVSTAHVNIDALLTRSLKRQTSSVLNVVTPAQNLLIAQMLELADCVSTALASTDVPQRRPTPSRQQLVVMHAPNLPTAPMPVLADCVSMAPANTDAPLMELRANLNSSQS